MEGFIMFIRLLSIDPISVMDNYKISERNLLYEQTGIFSLWQKKEIMFTQKNEEGNNKLLIQ